MYKGSLQDFYWKKGTHESLDCLCLYFNTEIIKRIPYLSNILKCDTLSDDMKVKIYHWLVYFEKFYQKYIIIPTESYNSSVPE